MMNNNFQPIVYKTIDSEPDYLLIHKRALIAISHVLGMTLSNYSIVMNCDLDQLFKELTLYANSHANHFDDYQVNQIITQLVDLQNQGMGVVNLKDFIDTGGL